VLTGRKLLALRCANGKSGMPRHELEFSNKATKNALSVMDANAASVGLIWCFARF